MIAMPELRGPDRHLNDGSERVPVENVVYDMTEAQDYALWLAGAKICRECEAFFVPTVRSESKWGSVCVPCLRAMGDLP
jgi:hypothetical protein